MSSMDKTDATLDEGGIQSCVDCYYIHILEFVKSFSRVLIQLLMRQPSSIYDANQPGALRYRRNTPNNRRMPVAMMKIGKRRFQSRPVRAITPTIPKMEVVRRLLMAAH